MKKIRYLILPLTAILLTSCFNFSFNFNSEENKQTGTTIRASTDHTYVHPVVTNDKNYYTAAPNPYSNKVIGNSKDVSFLSSVGQQKLLVIPVSFTNSPQKYKDDNQRVKATLNQAFFGESNEKSWESVASFYQKSSYNKLTITGEVSDIIHLNYSTTELEGKETGDEYWNESHYVLEDAYNALSAEKLTEYDSDKDGYVDAAFFVYLAPTGGDVFWAYQYFWNLYPWNNDPAKGKPVFNVYAWGSYEFCFEDDEYSEEFPAAHTFIHETGHMLGLDDYYDYDEESAPLGGADMMDNNIIDHNMYSKFVLNWALPYVPLGDTEIYLRPAESSGDFILINNTWNGSAYDEYILIEYFTPTGLNERDSLGAGYGAKVKSKGFSERGVRIYHVDSRVVEIRGNSKGEPYPYRYRDSLNTINPKYYFDYLTSNTPTTSYIETLKRIHLLDGAARPRTWYHTYTSANSDRVLFKTGQGIKNEEWKKYMFSSATFNDNSEIGYSIEIGAMDEDGVTIKLTTPKVLPDLINKEN